MNCPITHEVKKKGKILNIPCSAKLKCILRKEIIIDNNIITVPVLQQLHEVDSKWYIESKYKCPKCNKEFITYTSYDGTDEGKLVDTETGEIFE